MSIQSIKRRVRHFVEDTRGTVSVEFALMMPALFWAFAACYIFFDGYRQSASNLKAANTISDLISRETDAINDTYVDSMYTLLGMLIRSDTEVSMRITVIRWDEDADRYYVDWSANRGYVTDLSNSNISDIEAKLPIMPDNERVILVETSNTFVPLLNVGLETMNLDNFVFTRPRFVSQLVWETEITGEDGHDDSV